MVLIKRTKAAVRRRTCPFCEGKTDPDYKDVEMLTKYISDRAGLLGGDKTGICSKHQRKVSKAVKRARHLALLPFVGGF
jgi:small subunit ribosomal protein S18